ncbi:MAG: cytochrome c [Boseongicola sp.]|nr:MAG: cytochrome c [Boseongicola sp.]
MISLRSLAVSAAVVAMAGAAIADSHQTNPAIKARQALMELYGHNNYYLLNMSRGRIDYNAESAQAAADSLSALMQVSQMRMWAPGTDAESSAGTRASPDIWANFPDVFAKAGAVVVAVGELQQVAGDGADALAPAIAKVNGACNACHKDYRLPEG